jgi:hypothetical protein
MDIALTVSLLLALRAQAGEFLVARQPSLPARYWYGDPLREGTAKDVQKDLPRAVLATLDAGEAAALEKLKALGFALPKPHQYRFHSTVKDGKRIVMPPRGIILSGPNPNAVRGSPVPTLKDLQPLANLRHVERLSLTGPYFGDGALDLLGNMDVLWDLNMTDSSVTDGGLAKLGGLKALRRLRIGSPDITDAGVALLATFPRLEAIWLAGTRATDVGVAALGRSVNLEELVVQERRPGVGTVGDPAISALAGLPKLATLVIPYSRLTDDGLATMAKPGNYSKLARLDLSSTRITDAGIGLLHDPKALPALKSLVLGYSKVTREGVLALQKARPTLDIDASFPDGSHYVTRLNGLKK